MLILQANTRNRVANNNVENNGENNNNDANPPPPSAYSCAGASYASTNASDYAVDHGQHASCSAPGTATVVVE
jgi:hypothetical protein